MNTSAEPKGRTLIQYCPAEAIWTKTTTQADYIRRA